MSTIQLRTSIPGPRSQALMKRRDAAVVQAAYHATPVFVAKEILEHDLHRERQLRNARETILFGDFQGEIFVGLGADFQLLAALETVERGHRHRLRGDLGQMWPTYR